MEPTIVSALITSSAVLTVGLLGYFSKKVIASSKEASFIDIKGEWLASYDMSDDRIVILSQKNRNVTGYRSFKGKDNRRQKYIISGHFDGMVLSLSSTCDDSSDTRTCSITMYRKSGTVFRGMRTYLKNDSIKIVNSPTYDWVKQ